MIWAVYYVLYGAAALIALLLFLQDRLGYVYVVITNKKDYDQIPERIFKLPKVRFVLWSPIPILPAAGCCWYKQIAAERQIKDWFKDELRLLKHVVVVVDDKNTCDADHFQVNCSSVAGLDAAIRKSIFRCIWDYLVK